MITANVAARLRTVELLCLDVDGVQTDGGLYYAADGSELRRFHVHDGLGIKRVLAAGIKVAFITQSTTPAIAERARRLAITHCATGVDDKVAAVRSLCHDLGVDLANVAYMGDDINDLDLMRLVGCPLTVPGAAPEVAKTAIWSATVLPGQGAVRQLCDLLLSLRGPGN